MITLLRIFALVSDCILWLWIMADTVDVLEGQRVDGIQVLAFVFVTATTLIHLVVLLDLIEKWRKVWHGRRKSLAKKKDG